MNPYYYLFYKISLFLNKNGKNSDSPIYAITFFTGQYIGIFYIKYFSITENNFDEHKPFLIIILIFLSWKVKSLSFCNQEQGFLEASSGFEPLYKVLQTSA